MDRTEKTRRLFVFYLVPDFTMLAFTSAIEVLRLANRIAVMAEGHLTAVLDNADASPEVVMDYATRFSAEGTIA